MKAKRNPELRQECRIAREAGLVRFIPSINNRCKIHGGEHYTASGRCCECTKLAKSPAKQSTYWAENAEKIAAKRRAKYQESKNVH